MWWRLAGRQQRAHEDGTSADLQGGVWDVEVWVCGVLWKPTRCSCNARSVGLTHGWMKEMIDAWMEVWTYGWTDGQDVWTGGWQERWKD
eukprot:364358-Chlamydomonas_euryale.AAC.21